MPSLTTVAAAATVAMPVIFLAVAPIRRDRRAQSASQERRPSADPSMITTSFGAMSELGIVIASLTRQPDKFARATRRLSA